MSIIKKTAVFISSIALTVSVLQIPVSAENNNDFDDFLYDEFVAAMESNYLGMHYTVKDYESYGIEKPELIYADGSLEGYAEAVEEAQESLDQLESYDYDSLTDSQQHDYDAYHETLENTIALNSYPMFDMAFAPNGVLNDILTNFTEFKFYEKEDFDDYLTVLSTVPDYLDQLLELTEEQVSQGIFMTNSALDDSLETIDKFVEKTDDNQLIVIFNEDVESFGDLSDEEISSYEERNADIVIHSIIPAYQKVGETLETYRGSRTGDGSLYSIEGGQEYYAALVQYKTGSDDSIEDLFNEANDILDGYITDYIDLMYTSVDSSYEDETVEETTPEEILSYLSEHMLEYFPQGPNVTYTATYLDSSIADSTTVAYYLQPAIDDMTDNVIKINGDNVGDVNELYTTLAHEGFPGHLYQTTYYLNTNPQPIRSETSNMGYTEGWGMYAEIVAAGFSDLSEDAQRYLADNTAINYILDAVVDLAVNGLGYSESDLARYLDGLGLNSSIASDLISFVEDTPGILLPYGIGLAKFISIRNEAEEQLKDQFDLKEFHTVLLNNGSRPFDSVEKDVNNWINNYDHESDHSSSASPEQSAVPSTNEQNFNGSEFFIGLGIGGGIVLLIIILSVIRNKRRRI